MDLTKEERDYILKEFLRDLLHISDKEYQNRVWIEGKGPECDDFYEAVCRYSNTTDAIFDDYRKYGITDIQMNLIRNFHEEFKKFWQENDLPQLFIDTPEWTKITQMAKEVLDAFGYQQAKDSK